MQISLRDLTNDEQNVLQSTVILDSVLRRHRQCIGLSDGNALVYLILYMYIYICIYIYIYIYVCVCVCVHSGMANVKLMDNVPSHTP